MSDQPQRDEASGTRKPADEEEILPDTRCPVCGGRLISEKCKVVCRSEQCCYRIVFNCAEF